MASIQKKIIRGDSLVGYFKNKHIDNPYGLLAAEIVIHAIMDWRELIKQKAWLIKHPQQNCNFAELRIFFKSSWCEFLMENFELEPARILEVLEKELEYAMQRAEQEQRNRMKGCKK